jgi:two-component system cell cycle response regulator CpdR
LHQPSRILLVEDEHVLREIQSDYLAQTGFIVEACDSAEAAQAMLEQGTYRAIIADNKLAGSLTGADLLCFAADRYPSVGLVLLSGNPTPPRHLPVRTVFVSKPCTGMALTLALAEVTPTRPSCP